MATDVQPVDDFLAREKRLVGPPPLWVAARRSWECSAQWPIINDLGIQVGELRFKAANGSNASDSVSVIFRSNPIWRMDLAPMTTCEPNPPYGRWLELPAQVCGPHEHRWPDNRQHVIDNGFSELPFRRALAANLKRFEQMLPYLANEINLILEPDQRSFDGPPQKDMFRLGQA